MLCLTWKFCFCTLAEAAFWLAAFRFGLFGKESRFLFPVLLASVAGWFCGGVFTDFFAGKYAVSAAVLFVSLALLNKKYQAFVLNRLDARSWRGGLLPAGKKIRRWLTENLESGDSQNVIYALRVVENAGKKTFPVIFLVYI